MIRPMRLGIVLCLLFSITPCFADQATPPKASPATTQPLIKAPSDKELVATYRQSLAMATDIDKEAGAVLRDDKTDLDLQVQDHVRLLLAHGSLRQNTILQTAANRYMDKMLAGGATEEDRVVLGAVIRSIQQNALKHQALVSWHTDLRLKKIGEMIDDFGRSVTGDDHETADAIEQLKKAAVGAGG